jgi:uncharacterized delta-60 repeat protein
MFFNRSYYRYRRRFDAVIALNFALTLIASPTLVAQSFGEFDLSWGGTGRVVTAVSPGNGDDQPRAVVIQSDGKVVVGGSCANTFCMVRYLENGTLDNTFGQLGRVTQPLLGVDLAYGMALQPDGKLILVGECDVVNGLNRRFCVARFTTTGGLDSTFGAGVGWVDIDLRLTYDAAQAIALQPDGKILLAGTCFTFNGTLYDFCLVRLLPNGSLDTSFNGSGSVIIPRRGTDTRNDYATAVALQPNGMIIVVGYCEYAKDVMCAVRYKPDGSGVDPNFGGGGYIVWSDPNGSLINGFGDRAYSIVVQPNGKFIVGGNCNGQPCAVRFLETGVRDAAFGAEGAVFVSPGAYWPDPVVYGTVTLRPDGSILLTGRFAVFEDRDGIGGLFESTGILKTGQLTSDSGTRMGWRAHAVQADNKIVTIGACTETASDFCVSRFSGGTIEYRNCSLDIDGDGKVLATTDSLVHARIALGMTGSAVISGITFPTNAIRKLWPDIRNYLITQCGMSIA